MTRNIQALSLKQPLDKNETDCKSILKRWLFPICSNECKLYYNGSLIATGTDSGTHTTPGYFKIGTKHDNAASFEGKLGLFKIYKGRALTATEILDSYNMTKGRYE